MAGSLVLSYLISLRASGWLVGVSGSLVLSYLKYLLARGRPVGWAERLVLSYLISLLAHGSLVLSYLISLPARGWRVGVAGSSPDIVPGRPGPAHPGTAGAGT